jgi:predicted ArsR family transcriptional regulator
MTMKQQQQQQQTGQHISDAAIKRHLINLEVSQYNKRKKNILRKTGKPFDFYDTAYRAQNADAWIQEVKRREGML